MPYHEYHLHPHIGPAPGLVRPPIEVYLRGGLSHLVAEALAAGASSDRAELIQARRNNFCKFQWHNGPPNQSVSLPGDR